MGIQQAVEHERRVAEEKYTEGMLCHANPNDDKLDSCIECAKEHEQLAHWLEELQAYRTIGTIEEIRQMQRYSNLAKKHGTIGKVIDSCTEYEEIGTVDECREARERQMSKKIKNRSVIKTFPMSVHGDCPVCGSKNLSSADTDYCNACGQKLDWGEN